MNLNTFLYVLILAGSIQGAITGSLLYTAKPHRTANRLLAIIVWVIALPGVHLFGHYAQFFRNALVSDLIHALIPWVLVMAMGPLIYLYVRAVTEPAYIISKKDRLHFVPVLIDVFPKLVELLFIAGLLRGTVFSDRDALVHFTDIYNRYADLPRWLSLAYYVYLSGKYLRSCQAGKSAAPTTHWVSRFIMALQIFVVIWLIYLIPYLIPATNLPLRQKLDWFPVYLPMATLIYWIGITGYKEILITTTQVKEKGAEPAYVPELLAQTAQTLQHCMEKDRLFLNPELDLAVLAAATGLPAKLISATLNQYLNSGFSQFINEYRVEEFKKRVLQPEATELTLAGLAASCGFSSQATFQRIFKQITGVTPAAYKKSAQPTA